MTAYVSRKRNFETSSLNQKVSKFNVYHCCLFLIFWSNNDGSRTIETLCCDIRRVILRRSLFLGRRFLCRDFRCSDKTGYSQINIFKKLFLWYVQVQCLSLLFVSHFWSNYDSPRTKVFTIHKTMFSSNFQSWVYPKNILNLKFRRQHLASIFL